MTQFILAGIVFFLGFHSFAETCQYEFDVSQSVVEGTGFKFTEKSGVTARFTGIKTAKKDKSTSLTDLINGQTVTVDLMSIDSGNALRDQNLRESLFAGILGDSVATITVKKVTDKKIETEMKINEKTKPVVFDYSIVGDVISAKGKFDAMDFAMQDSIAAMKKRCGSLHTGPDGKSVTWAEFEMSVKAKTLKKCK